MWLIYVYLYVYKSLPLLLLLACCSFLLPVLVVGRAAFSGPILERDGMG